MVGDKFYKLIYDESNHSKWEEFRRMAQSEGMGEECANLLRRMELEESDAEDENSHNEMTVDDESYSLGECLGDNNLMRDDQGKVCEQEDQMPDQEALLGDNDAEKDIGERKAKKRQKVQWGPTLRVDRPRRVPEDGMTIMQKAQALKEKKNTIKGMTQKPALLLKAMRIC